MISSELISKPPHALRALRGTSLSRSIVLAIGISLVVIQLFALAVTLYRDHGEIVQAELFLHLFEFCFAGVG